MNMINAFPSYFPQFAAPQAIVAVSGIGGVETQPAALPDKSTAGVSISISPEARDAYMRYIANPDAQSMAAQKNPAALTYDSSGTSRTGPERVTGPGNAETGPGPVAKAFEAAECKTCSSRKYQDDSNDPSVSFQSPTHLSPNEAASSVAAHEGEHVAHEQAKAKQEGKEIISQTVTLHTSICPECGRVYVSGGVTRTVTAEKPETHSEDHLN